jgi:hypothetical protein
MNIKLTLCSSKKLSEGKIINKKGGKQTLPALKRLDKIVNI